MRGPDKPTSQRLVQIAFENGDAPHGWVDPGDGTRRPFWGWLELMQTIEDALATGERTRESATTPRVG